MQNGPQKLTRSDRVASLDLTPSRWSRVVKSLKESRLWVRVLCCTLAAICMLAITHAWTPPFSYRTGYIPQYNLTPRVTFEVRDQVATDRQEELLRASVITFYANETKPLVQLAESLKTAMFQVLGAESFEQLDQEAWSRFLPEEGDGTADQEAMPEVDREQLFREFRASLAGDLQLNDFGKALERAFAPHLKSGLLSELTYTEGSLTDIWVYPLGEVSRKELTRVEDVLIASATVDLEERLNDELKVAQMAPGNVELVAKLCTHWLNGHGFPSTLTFNRDDTAVAMQQAVEGMEDVMKKYTPDDRIVDAGKPLNDGDLALLKFEYDTVAEGRGLGDACFHLAASLGMYLAVYVLCGAYILHYKPALVTDLRQLVTTLLLAVATVAFCWVCARNEWRAESVPIMVFGLVLCVAYDRELALLLSTTLALVVVLSLGLGLAQLVIMVAGASSAVLTLGRVRSRTKLIYVGLLAGLVMAATTIGVGTLAGQTFGSSGGDPILFGWRLPLSADFTFVGNLLAGAGWHLFCAVLAGVLMTGALPFVEKAFSVQTDLSLLEWGDAAHPLLQELAQRAPGTYNHSINVASLSEKAADAIGANGLLCRVGAYFHDIGKILKPGYFIENQGMDANRHEALAPAMSTLVIIAHVKDGADLARQHGLPQAMIDFIEQHHGTTLVEYFYRQATKQTEDDPHSDEVDESTFRYPGPKPRTREAAVMMLADAVESASRVLTDPSPARIESLVSDLAMKRLVDGQFDDCDLTLADLHQVQESLVGSLASMYHGRIKYPDQPQTA
ncbi:MAG: metal-dependent phosphohydrolase [Blastopirellula sp.]|nr:metal-dependent phosphohydrolase [Blastopirellula sp.]